MLQRGRCGPGCLGMVLVVRLPAALAVPQRVAVLAGYLNYPSALIRQSGESRGRQAERERSRWELRARGRAGTCLWRGCEEEEGGEGVLLPLRCCPKGCLCQALQNSWWIFSSGRAVGTGMGFDASSEGLTCTLHGAPSTSVPAQHPHPTALPNPLSSQSQLRKRGHFSTERSRDPILEHPLLRHLSPSQRWDVASRSAVSPLSPAPAREVAPGWLQQDPGCRTRWGPLPKALGPAKRRDLKADG